jgi:serine/threonine protein phosphatase PrpC
MSTMTADSAGQDHAELNAGLLVGVTDRGLRHHRNEDAIALRTVAAPEGPVAIAVVSDGVSSAPHPDKASLAAVRAGMSVLAGAAEAGSDLTAASEEAVLAAASALRELAGPDGNPAATYVSAIALGSTALGSTAVGSTAVGSTGPEAGGAVLVCWLGDSRAYWLAADPAQCERLTTDHSLAEELVAAGLATPEEALASPQAHVITRWLGADMPDMAPHFRRFPPPGQGLLLVCSDGLWNYRPEAAGLAALLEFPQALAGPLAAAKRLVDFAVEEGGMDNITVALIPFQPPS